MAERKLKNGDEFTVGGEMYRVKNDKLYRMVEAEVDSHRCCDHVCWHYTITPTWSPWITSGTGDFPLLDTTTTYTSDDIGSVLSSSGALN